MKLLIKNNLILVSFILFSFGNSSAQLVFPSSEEGMKHHAYITTGLEPLWVSTLGYTHMIGKETDNVKMHIGSSVKVAPLIALRHAWRINFITAADWKWSKNWRTTLVSEIYLAQQQNRAGVMNGIGIEFRAMPSFYGKRWSKGLDIGWQYTALAHIRHSSETHITFNDRYLENENGIDGSKDGWYGSTANRFRLGYVSTRELGSNLSLTVAGGVLISLQNQGILMGFSHAQFPFYLQSGLIYRW